MGGFFTILKQVLFAFLGSKIKNEQSETKVDIEKKEIEPEVPVTNVVPIVPDMVLKSERKVTWKKSPNFRLKRGRKITAIILHHTGTFKGKNDIAWMCNPTAKVSAHYVIDLDGSITQLVKDEDVAWHAGKSELDGEKYVNNFSIGIEIVGDTTKKPFTEDQWEAMTWLVRKLIDKYKIDHSRVVDHRYVAPGRKVDLDPKNFDWTRFYEELGAI